MIALVHLSREKDKFFIVILIALPKPSVPIMISVDNRWWKNGCGTTSCLLTEGVEWLLLFVLGEVIFAIQLQWMAPLLMMAISDCVHGRPLMKYQATLTDDDDDGYTPEKGSASSKELSYMFQPSSYRLASQWQWQRARLFVNTRFEVQRAHGNDDKLHDMIFPLWGAMFARSFGGKLSCYWFGSLGMWFELGGGWSHYDWRAYADKGGSD